MTAAIVVLVIALAAANGANDVSKSVATLVGAGVSRYRPAILWGAAATVAGAVASIPLGRAMGALFSTGIVAAAPTAVFTVSVLVGTVAWVTTATVARLPVSTTHALVGALLGAGMLFVPRAVRWGGLLTAVIAPLLLSILAAYVATAAITMIAAAAARRRAAADDGPGAMRAPTQTCHPRAGGAGRMVTGVHWVSSGAAAAARGVNDTPKIAAIAGFALIPAGLTSSAVTVLVAAAMGLGSLAGIRVARNLAENVIAMNHHEGVRANAVTAVLIAAGAGLGWPMSLTHVSTGAIAGSVGTQRGRINRATLRDFALAWTLTPAFAALVAAASYAVLQ